MTEDNKLCYDIKAQNTSCYPVNKGFTGIEVDGVRFSNIIEMLRYMNRQREQLIKARLLLSTWIEFVNNEVEFDPEHSHEFTDSWNELCKQAEQFLKEEI